MAAGFDEIEGDRDKQSIRGAPWSGSALRFDRSRSDLEIGPLKISRFSVD
jgi:hypothetical protein